MKVETRNLLFYNKYKYRARFKLPGIHRTWYTKTFEEYTTNLNNYIANIEANSTRWGHHTDKIAAQKIEVDSIHRYLIWRDIHYGHGKTKNKNIIIRLEGDKASFFSNDLTLLQSLSSIQPADPNFLKLTEVDASVPLGVRYFKKQPKHNYRIYFKPGRIKPEFRHSLKEVIARYKGTATALFPSGALDYWLTDHSSQYRRTWLPLGYSIDFDLESTYTLLSLMFDGRIKSRFQLLKRP